MDAALLRRVEQQRIEMLYDNTLAVSGSALLMTALIAVIAWPHTRVTNIVAWAGAALLVQASVLALSAAYRRASDPSRQGISGNSAACVFAVGPRPALGELHVHLL